MSTDYLGTRAVAERCGVAPRTVARWVDAGVLPAVFTTGGHRRVKQDDVDRFLESRRSLMALDRQSPALRVVVLGPLTVKQAIVDAAAALRREATVDCAPDLFEAALAVGHLKPHLIVIAADRVEAESLAARFRLARHSAHAYVVTVANQAPLAYGAVGDTDPHRRLATPLRPDTLARVLDDADRHRELAAMASPRSDG